ncbi:MAG: hypothetical protein LBB91_04970 [Clostridiales bacterium]|jgi:hypothetical protein|nr:hypothetical protein [Clostridiales bacterium]
MESTAPKKMILLLGSLCLLLVLGTAWEIMRLGKIPVEDPASPAGQSNAYFVSEQTMVREEIYYTNCRHLESRLLINDSAFANKSFEELELEGWNVFWAEGGQAVAFKEVAQLCSADENKLHIGEYNGRIAIFSGPAGSEGRLIEELGVPLENLYPEWQAKLAEGGIDFENQEDLLAALDNLDEFKYP